MHHTRINLSLFHHNINVLICLPKLYLILFQICGAGSVFWECWFPHLCDHSAGPLSLHLSAHCSHASFWAKYIFREILSSKSYARLSQCTQNPLLTAFFTTFIELEKRNWTLLCVSTGPNQSLFIQVNHASMHECSLSDSPCFRFRKLYRFKP